MIVTCSRCQARFRVADEKVGPRGAKVRCSRCQNVFAVYPQAGAAPRPPVPFDLDLTPGLPKSRPARPPAAPAPDPFGVGPAAGAPAASPDPDPFAAAGLHALSAEPPHPDDPFARAAGLYGPPATDDPFAASAPGSGDPFGAGPAADGVSVAPPAGAGAGNLPLTDLAQLLGAPGSSSPGSAPRAPAPPAAAADPFALSSALAP